MSTKKDEEFGLEFSSSNEEDNESGVEVKGKGKSDDTAESTNAEDDEEEERVKEFPEKDIEHAFFSSDSKIFSCVNRICGFKKNSAMMGNGIFGFSKKKAFSRFCCVKKHERTEKNVFTMYKQLAGGFGGIQAVMKSMEDDIDVNVFSRKLDELVVKMYCK